VSLTINFNRTVATVIVNLFRPGTCFSMVSDRTVFLLGEVAVLKTDNPTVWSVLWR